jgi:transcriptional regulator with XRE-family HTH domain
MMFFMTILSAIRKEITMTNVNGRFLKKQRKIRSMTLDELAKAAKVDRQTIWRLESGKRTRASNTTVKKLADALHIPEARLKGDAPNDELPATQPAANGKKSQLGYRISEQARNALLLVANHYEVDAARIVELAPFLFLWAAEEFLRRQRAKLDELIRLRNQTHEAHESFGSAFSNHFSSPPPPFEEHEDVDEAIAEEDMALSLRILLRGTNDREPFAEFLAELAEGTSGNATFEDWEGGSSPSYRVCEAKVLQLVGGDDAAAESIFLGHASLHENMTDDDWKDVQPSRFIFEQEPNLTAEKEARAKRRLKWALQRGLASAGQSEGP